MCCNIVFKLPHLAYLVSRLAISPIHPPSRCFSHLTLKIVNIVLQSLSSFHLDCEEVVVVPLEFSPRSKVVVKRIGYFMKILEQIPRERIKPVVGDTLEADGNAQQRRRSLWA